MKWKHIMAFGFVVSFLLAGCAKRETQLQNVNEAIQEINYMRVKLGENYHQEEVLFDMQSTRAVVPKGAAWGLPKYRDGDETGMNYGGEEGVDIYESDREVNPELYNESYFDSIRNLNLSTKEVRDNGYTVQVVKEEQLELFEEELSVLSGMVVSDGYELAGVEVKFDEKFRPIEKIFQFEKKNSTNLGNEKQDSMECMQTFSYDVGKINFWWSFNRVKRAIEKEY